MDLGVSLGRSPTCASLCRWSWSVSLAGYLFQAQCFGWQPARLARRSHVDVKRTDVLGVRIARVDIPRRLGRWHIRLRWIAEPPAVLHRAPVSLIGVISLTLNSEVLTSRGGMLLSSAWSRCAMSVPA
jgi:hypothetical protein